MRSPRSRWTKPASTAAFSSWCGTINRKGRPPQGERPFHIGEVASLRSGGDLRRFVSLQHLLAGLAGADANCVVDRQQEDLPVTDRAGPRVPQDRVGHDVDGIVVDDALEPELRPQVDRELRTAVVLGDPLLPARPLRLENRKGRVAGLEEILADRLEGLVPDV